MSGRGAHPNSKANLRMWQKGQSGNPLGKPKELLTMDQVRVLMQRFCKLTKKELRDIVENDNSTMIEVMVAGVMAKAAANGDHMRLEFLMARCWGKVKEEVQQTVHYHPAIDKEPRENILKVLRDLRGPRPEGET